MESVLLDMPVTDASPVDLRAALGRIAELEAEVRRLRAEQTGGAFTHMRLHDVEACLVKQALDRAQGNISRAARALGLSRAALYRRLERHSLERNIEN